MRKKIGMTKKTKLIYGQYSIEFLHGKIYFLSKYTLNSKQKRKT